MQIDPRQLQQMMKQMGIKTEQIDAKRVIIEKDEERIVIDGPAVMRMDAKGDVTYQISGGTATVKPIIPAEDVELVMSQANVSKDAASAALEETDGDVAEAIMKLKK